jgi:5-oxoprolinase (ATP-hydrolysing) subunit A
MTADGGVALSTFDVNCDMGESLGNWVMGSDEEIMPHITTANVACGYHGGDPVTMERTVALAQRHGVAVGAHPGFPDLLGFGRRRMDLSPEDAAAYVTYQAGALRGFLDAAGMPLHHIKPHGAFFAFLRDEEAMAEPVANAIAAFGDDVMLYWPAPAEGIPFCDAVAAEGVEIVPEIYPDLTYAPDGKLVVERHKKAADPEFAAAQVTQFLRDGTVSATDGSPISLAGSRSACVHGDAANAVVVAQAVGAAAEAAGYEVGAVTRG